MKNTKKRLPSHSSGLSQYGWTAGDFVHTVPDFIDIYLYKRDDQYSALYLRFNDKRPVGLIAGTSCKDYSILEDPTKGVNEHTDLILIYDMNIPTNLSFFRD